MAHPSRLAVKNGEHLRMTAVIAGWQMFKSSRDMPGHDGGGIGKRRVLVVLASLCIFVVAATGIWVASLGPLPLAQAQQVSTTVVDRNGKLLRAYAMADGRWRLPVDARSGVDPGYLKLLLAYEDRRFRSHS